MGTTEHREGPAFPLVALKALSLAFFMVTSQWLCVTASAGADESDRTLVTLFERDGCTHCAREAAFLAALQAEGTPILVERIDIGSKAGRHIFDKLTDRYQLPKVTPITVIGERFIIGFDAPASTGAEIRRWITETRGETPLQKLLERPAEAPAGGQVCNLRGPCTPSAGPSVNLPYTVQLPLVGVVDLRSFTLPALSLILGAVDGFNPCAMWVLVVFLTALAQAGSVTKMVQFAGLLIAAQGLMYLLILNFWVLAFDFIAADRIVVPIIGVLAIGGGLFFLWEFKRADATCRITNMERRSRTTAKLKELSQKHMTPLVVLGILAVAFSVNVVEFACSIGIPQTYTKVLELNQVALPYREILMGLYVLAYMLDDLAVFGLAIWSIHKIGITTRYSKISNLVGGLIMIGLGLLFLLAPEKLRL